MGEYGPGLTMGQIFNIDKERIKHALAGELLYTDTESGELIYRPASPEECREFILRKFDNAVFHCLEQMKFGRVYDWIIEKNGIHYTIQDILISKRIEDERPCDYQYEPFEGDEE